MNPLSQLWQRRPGFPYPAPPGKSWVWLPDILGPPVSSVFVDERWVLIDRQSE